MWSKPIQMCQTPSRKYCTNWAAAVVARAAVQVKAALDATVELGGEHYVFWGGREGYASLVNTQMKREVEHFARSVSHADIAATDYNLSVSSYVEAKDTREVVDIAQLNAQLKTTVAKIDQLRKDIDAIVAEIEGEEQQA